jgi:hypothetical protein
MSPVRVILCVAAAVLVADAASQAQPLPGAFYIRGSVGLAAQSLKDWNDDIKADEQLLLSVGIPASFETFGPGFPIGLESGYQISDVVSLGAALTYQKASVSNSISDASGSLSSDGDVSLTALVASVSIWMPEARGWFFGGNVGLGLGKATSEAHFRDFTTPSNDIDATGDWDGNAPILGVFAGYEQTFPKGQLFFVRLGYQYQNLDVLDGIATSPQLGNRSGPPIDNAGQALETDFSGVQIAVGFGFAFGGK